MFDPPLLQVEDYEKISLFPEHEEYTYSCIPNFKEYNVLYFIIFSLCESLGLIPQENTSKYF